MRKRMPPLNGRHGRRISDYCLDGEREAGVKHRITSADVKTLLRLLLLDVIHRNRISHLDDEGEAVSMQLPDEPFSRID